MEYDFEDLADEELVRLAKTGNSGAEEALIRKYKDVVKGKAHLYFIMGADAEDVVQEGMIGIFKAIRDYDCQRQAAFRTFAELCINRQIITAIKRANRMKHAPLNMSVSLNKPLSENDPQQTLEETLYSDSDTDPEARVLLKEVIDFVVANGDELFSKMELTVWSEYLQGKGYVKIAEEMGKNPKAIDNAIQRIRKKISSYMLK